VMVDPQPPIGAPVVIGKTPGQVVRLLDGGVAVEFSRAFLPEEFAPDIIL